MKEYYLLMGQGDKKGAQEFQDGCNSLSKAGWNPESDLSVILSKKYAAHFVQQWSKEIEHGQKKLLSVWLRNNKDIPEGLWKFLKGRNESFKEDRMKYVSDINTTGAENYAKRHEFYDTETWDPVLNIIDQIQEVEKTQEEERLKSKKREENTLVSEWVSKTDMSKRLKNVLSGHYSGNPPYEYLEEITERDFKMRRYAGQATWNEFTILRGKEGVDMTAYK